MPRTQTARTSANTCVHHWLCEPTDTTSGGLVGAACARCGVARTFDPFKDDREGRRRDITITAYDRRNVETFGKRATT